MIIDGNRHLTDASGLNEPRCRRHEIKGRQRKLVIKILVPKLRLVQKQIKLVENYFNCS